MHQRRTSGALRRKVFNRSEREKTDCVFQSCFSCWTIYNALWKSKTARDARFPRLPVPWQCGRWQMAALLRDGCSARLCHSDALLRSGPQLAPGAHSLLQWARGRGTLSLRRDSWYCFLRRLVRPCQQDLSDWWGRQSLIHICFSFSPNPTKQTRCHLLVIFYG